MNDLELGNVDQIKKLQASATKENLYSSILGALQRGNEKLTPGEMGDAVKAAIEDWFSTEDYTAFYLFITEIEKAEWKP